jgi:hypothetical protein
MYCWHVNRDNAKIEASSHSSTGIRCTAAGPGSDIFCCLSKHSVLSHYAYFLPEALLSGVVSMDMPEEWIPHTDCGRRS